MEKVDANRYDVFPVLTLFFEFVGLRLPDSSDAFSALLLVLIIKRPMFYTWLHYVSFAYLTCPSKQ
jgi:hypothetical protein